jgi:hypothetical protein
MPKITIKDLPRDVKVSSEEMRRVLGGTTMRINPWSRSVIIKTEPGPNPPESETHGYHTSDDGYVIVY